MNKQWLTDNSDIPIRYILTKDNNCIDKLLKNKEVQYWLSQLKRRSDDKNLNDIHGSHDYRLENILGKSCVLGLSKIIPEFHTYMQFILDFLSNHVKNPDEGELTFGKIYSFRDYETVLACFLPMLGYSDEPAVQYITEKRINILYNFTKQKRYDIYVDGSKLKGVKKEWQQYIINPEIYADGNIALPTMHDYILFAGMFNYLDGDMKSKVETIVEWIFDSQYMNISRRYGYFYVPGGSYNAKAIIFKMHLPNFKDMTFDDSDLGGLIFTCFILSHFEAARNSEWFQSAMGYLNKYKTSNDRYIFPKHMIAEKPDSYVIFGGHMNVGENKKSKLYAEIISTYWMHRIRSNLDISQQ